MKVGLIAGSGDLPLAVLEGCAASDTELHVIALRGTPTHLPAGMIAKTLDPAKLGKITRNFKRAGCTHICMAGNVSRPDFSALKPDLKGLRHLPSVLRAAKRGDDALLSTIVASFENDGFQIIAPQDLCAHIVMPDGFLGQMQMSVEHKDDSEKACRIARQIGALDIGQAAVVCDGLVLAVEAQEGTDAMLRRVAALPETLRGTAAARKGVLAKMIKPGQETRVDLPSIGITTIELADAAGLAGIVTEGGGSFVFSRDEVARQADALGMFVAGLPSVQR